MSQQDTVDIALTLSHLIRLQELEAELGILLKKVNQAPADLSALSDQLEAAKATVSSVEERITDSGKHRKRLESDVEMLREKLSKLKTQLMEVKTNTAYTAMLDEIKFAENKIKEKEDEILDQMMQAEELKEARATAHAGFETAKAAIEAQQAEISRFVSESETQIEKLQAEKAEIARRIPNQYMARYNRISAARSGVALTPVANQSCGACHVRLRPQLLAEIKARQDIILCENCNRILYFSNS